MTAGVEDDDRAGVDRLEPGDHGVEIDPPGGGVIVRIGVDLEAGGFEQRAVVLPAWVADVDLGIRVDTAQEVGTDLERAGAAECLQRDCAAGCDECRVGAEQQCLHRFVVDRGAFDRLVAARRGALQARSFRRLDRPEQRNLAVVVVVHADAQIHLGRAGVGLEGFGQAENRVAGRQFNGGKNRRGHCFSIHLPQALCGEPGCVAYGDAE